MQNDVLYNRIMSQINSSGGGSGLKLCKFENGRLNITASELIESLKKGIIVGFVENGEYDGDIWTNVYTCNNYSKAIGNSYSFPFCCFGRGSNNSFILFGYFLVADSLDDYPFED